MKVNYFLDRSIKKLVEAGIGTARLDCLVLLEDVTEKNRAHILAHSESELTENQIALLNNYIDRRTKHEPLAFIRGKTEFYGREFIVRKNVLEPRPESETMIDLLKQMVNSQQSTVNSQLQVIDVGTGSGCLAITAKLEIPELDIFATDIDDNCLLVAKQNAKKLGAEIIFYQGDFLQPIPSTVYRLPTTLLCNLPYVPDGHTINKAATMEPKTAIFGGPDGLDLYRRLFDQISKLKSKPEFIITESLPFQHKELARIALAYGNKLDIIDDFIQVFHKD